MEAASTSRLNLGLGVGMDTVASGSLSPLPRHGHPSFSSPASCRPGPRLLKLLKPRSLTSGASNLPSAAPRSRPRPWSSSGAAAAAPPPPPPQKEKEKDLVFVAGATGRVGSRAVRELIKLGFRVRAAVRSAERASSLVQVLSLLAHQ
jgi:hypothetical protein